MHNSFDILELDGGFKALSHNFPEIEGMGKTEKEAIDSLNNKITYFADNSASEFKKRIKSRIKRKLECECGIPLTEKPLGIYTQRG